MLPIVGLEKWTKISNKTFAKFSDNSRLTLLDYNCANVGK